MYVWQLHVKLSGQVTFGTSKHQTKQGVILLSRVRANVDVTHLAGKARSNRYELTVATAKTIHPEPDSLEEVDSSFFREFTPRSRATTFRVNRIVRIHS